MKRRVWLALGVALAAAVAVGAVLYPRLNELPYATPIVEKPADGGPDSFPGLLDLVAAAAPGAPVRVLWTHGMCTHPPSWVDERAKKLAAAVGGSHQSGTVRQIGRHGASLRTERISVGANALEIVFLSWSPVTAPLKRALEYDRSVSFGGDFPYRRATLNRELKSGLVNDCLVDVVTYAGPNGNPIRSAMVEAVCEALGGRIADGECDLAGGRPPGSLALVVESLGTKMIFDAILNIGAAVEGRRDDAATDRLANALAATRMIYLLSNQVPLLDSADPPDGSTKVLAPSPSLVGASVARSFALLARMRERLATGQPPLTAVAFSDPNDLLSYRLVPAFLGDHARHFRIFNVVVSNAATHIGLFERPDTAHCGYAWNPHVLAMVAEGHRAGQPPRRPQGSLAISCHRELGLGGG